MTEAVTDADNKPAKAGFFARAWEKTAPEILPFLAKTGLAGATGGYAGMKMSMSQSVFNTLTFSDNLVKGIANLFGGNYGEFATHPMVDTIAGAALEAQKTIPDMLKTTAVVGGALDGFALGAGAVCAYTLGKCTFKMADHALDKISTPANELEPNFINNAFSNAYATSQTLAGFGKDIVTKQADLAALELKPYTDFGKAMVSKGTQKLEPVGHWIDSHVIKPVVLFGENAGGKISEKAKPFVDFGNAAVDKTVELASDTGSAIRECYDGAKSFRVNPAYNFIKNATMFVLAAGISANVARTTQPLQVYRDLVAADKQLTIRKQAEASVTTEEKPSTTTSHFSNNLPNLGSIPFHAVTQAKSSLKQ